MVELGMLRLLFMCAILMYEVLRLCGVVVVVVVIIVGPSFGLSFILRYS